MTNKELYHKLITDLETLKLPVNEVDLCLRPYSKTFYGRYYPTVNEKVKRPRVFIYPYAHENKKTFLPYNDLLRTTVHEMIHHVQYTSGNFIRLNGVMHDTEFWRLNNHYIDKAEKLGLIKETKQLIRNVGR